MPDLGISGSLLIYVKLFYPAYCYAEIFRPKSNLKRTVYKSPEQFSSLAAPEPNSKASKTNSSPSFTFAYFQAIIMQMKLLLGIEELI